MKKEKTVKTHTRKTKSGKTITVKQHTAKYDAAEQAKEIVRKAGAGAELERVRKARPMRDPYEDFDFTKEEFAEWYEGTGSKADKKVEKILRKMLGKKAYDELNDAAADHYKAGGAAKFFASEVQEGRSPASQVRKTSPKPAGSEGGEIVKVDDSGRETKGPSRNRMYLPPATVAFKKKLAEAWDAEDGDRIYWEYKKANPGWDADGEIMKHFEIEPLKHSIASIKRRVQKEEAEKKAKESRKSKSKSANSEYEKVEFKNPTRADYPTGTFYVKDGKVYQEVDGKMKKVSRKELGAKKYDSVLRRLKASKTHFEGLGGLAEDAKRIGHIRSTSMSAMADFGKSESKGTRKRKKKNTPEEDAALDATLAEIRERNKQPYQVSRRI